MSGRFKPKTTSGPTLTVGASESGGHARRDKIAKRVMDEMRRFLIMFLYLWLLFGLFALHQDIILRSQGIGVEWQGAAIINALVLAKVMLVAEDLDLGRWAPRRPLVFPILLDAAILTILFIAFHFVEEKVVAMFRGVSAKEAALGGGGIEGLLCVAAIVFVSLIPFFAVQHLGRTLGADKLMTILLSRADLPERQRD
jgi:hypothetical protein